ncbi:MAG: glycosyltransferase family 4 protein [Opitutales bacterium]|jgi:hypothetical protein|nr:glycosyltransferase family 4 protein [Opitutales bacterium]
MKILTVVYDLEIGVTQRVAQSFALAYNELGHDSRVLAVDGLGARYEELQDCNVQVYLGLSQAIIEELREWMPELLHLHSHLLREQDVRSLVDSLTPRPVVVETNVFSKPSPWEDLLYASFQLGAWPLGLYRLRGGVDIACVLPNAVNASGMSKAEAVVTKTFRREIDVPEDAFVLGRIGQPYPGKWDERIVGIFDALCRGADDCYFVCIGAPDTIKDAFAKSPNIKHVRFIDRVVGDKKLSIAYSSFDVFLLAANQGESFGMVLVEAALCQVPVVTLATPWADNTQCEVVVDGESGYVNLTMGGAIRSIRKLYDSPELRRSMGVTAAKLAERFSHIRLANQVLQIVQNSEGTGISSDPGRGFFKWKSEEMPPLCVRLLLFIGSKTSLYMSKYVREDIGATCMAVDLVKKACSKIINQFR